MAKSLCKLVGNKILKKDPAAYIDLVSKPRFVCLNCGRVANSKKNLCKPENMKNLS
jgi:hypothetical protein